ncbi:TPA: DUF551 domain-containing protein [Escherichia albertii]|uniref:DUF551 domain-containing protein n=2 Tax=Enterobacteriaceae TaxID=543 RepID=A0A765T7D6_ECOLX|nr:DUF551 domain-containing protein [Escherichia albertii]EGM7736457.1 DUF551 domain-containing protein [Escherichia albertii]EHW5677718.1 DUF551 domain-containing protein [Escherichia albertii]EHX2146067.1 DUF551 domain-containing protein [Escherichia albertii]MCI5279681.1 DUF551 domain-containing protein [Escherichia albertii]
MSTITKERIELFIKSPLENGLTRGEQMELARIALASLEAEKVTLYRERNPYNGMTTGWQELTEQEYEFVKDNASENAEFRTVYTAPPAPVIQADVAQAIENLKQKLVECNRYNYCADAVKGVEDASRVLALQNQNISAPLTSEAIENAIEFIRSIAFHINEDDYHGKHIAYFMRQALAWLEGHSCSDDRQGKADNQPASGSQAAESNRGNEWTGNPDIDNAIIMLDRIDTAESYDDDRIEAAKAVLRRLAGNSPVTPDGWISCSERMPNEEDVLVYCSDTKEQMVGFHKGKGLFQFFYMNGVEGVCEPSHWMPLPEPPL